MRVEVFGCALGKLGGFFFKMEFLYNYFQLIVIKPKSKYLLQRITAGASNEMSQCANSQ